MSEKILIIIQARLTSTRLPGKVLMKIGDTTVIEKIYRTCKSVAETTVAIPYPSNRDADLSHYLSRNRIPYYTGDEDNVLSRYVLGAIMFEPEHVVRITSDCPFISADLIKLAIKCHLENDADYTCYDKIVSGLDVEVYKASALSAYAAKCRDPYEREHVKIAGKHHRITKLSLDTQEDYDYLIRLDN